MCWAHEKQDKIRLFRIAKKRSETILHRGLTESEENMLKTFKLPETESANSGKATAIH